MTSTTVTTFRHPVFAYPVTLTEIVAEARWLWTCARALRNNRGAAQAERLEGESLALIRAAREIKNGLAKSVDAYKLDDATFAHLSRWAEVTLRDEEREEVVGKIIAYLEGGSIDDAEYSLAHGWSHIRDLVA